MTEPTSHPGLAPHVGARGDVELGPDGQPHRGRPGAAEAAQLRDGFGAALLRARAARDWSTRTLAGRSGVSRRHLRNLEAGSRRPRAVTIRALAAALAPAEPAALAAELLAVAGASVRADTARAVRQRRRAAARARRTWLR